MKLPISGSVRMINLFLHAFNQLGHSIYLIFSLFCLFWYFYFSPLRLHWGDAVRGCKSAQTQGCAWICADQHQDLYLALKQRVGTKRSIDGAIKNPTGPIFPGKKGRLTQTCSSSQGSQCKWGWHQLANCNFHSALIDLTTSQPGQENPNFVLSRSGLRTWPLL